MASIKVEFPRRRAMLTVMEPVYEDGLFCEVCVGEREVDRVPVFVWTMPTSEGIFVVERQDGTVQIAQPDLLTFLGSKELFDQYDWREQ